MTISNSNGYYQPLITVTAGSTILIYNSSFTKNWNYLKGGVASVDTLGASLRIFNSNFENNTSIQGGVFNVENQGLLSITNWVLNCNFAVQSGVIQSSNEGYFTIYSSQIVNNYAYSISVGELFLVSTQSLINNSTISNNQWLTKTYIIQQLDNWSALWFINSDFRNYLIQNSDLMDVNSIYSSLQLISSSLSIVNASSIANQSYVAEWIQSNLTISDSSIKNLKIDSDLVYLSATTLNLNNITFERISVASADTSIIFGVLYSAVSANNVRYSNSSWRFINLDSSTLSIFKLTANSVSLDSYLMNFLSCYSISVADSNIYSINSASSSVIYSSNSQFDQIRNVTLLDLNTTGIDFSKSNVTQISRLLISRSPKGMKLKNTVISTFSSSQFVSWGSSNIVYGGAVDAIDSSIYLYNSTANQNIAQNGAAISIRCSNYDLCDNKIAGSSFESNAAEVKGGAIYYNFRRPQITDIKFTNNSAPYGSNIASYSVKIIEQTSKNASITFNNIPSGIKLGSTLELILQDYDNQTIPDSSYQIKISPITSNASVSGYDSARAVEGVASFKNLIFIFSPGSQHIRYKATSNAINAQSNNALGIPSYSTIDISFRYWKPGESQISKSECQTCAPGTYSFEWNSTSWTNWISDTICAGGAIVEVNPGYWRISTNSTTVLNCPYPSAWLGGYDSESKYPVKWETGYIGYLWAEWDIVDGVKYEKASGNLWNKCSDPVLNALKFIAIVIAAFAFLMIMIILILRKRKENQTSILIRILTNYLQLISLSMSFNLRFPSSLTQAFNAFDTIGSSSDTFLSYDWFFTSIQVTGFTPSVQLFKILLTGLLPLILFAACSLIWILLYYSMNKWFSNLKLNMVVSAICIIFLLHPTITKSALLVFEWIVVDANDKRMKMYMEYKWYSAEILYLLVIFTWIAFVSLPTLIVWVIGAPCLAFIILYKYRHNLEDKISLI